MRMKFIGFSVALVLLLAVSACREVHSRDLVGVWQIRNDTRANLPADMRQAAAKLTLNQDGTFVASGMPALFFVSGLRPAQLEAGSGYWKLVLREGRQQVQLDFQKIDRWNSGLPFGYPLEVSGARLSYYIGDPDEVRIVTLEKQ